MDLSQAYAEVKQRIDNIRFDALWKGFHPFPFALYDDERCFWNGEYVEKTDDFLANTAIEYRGTWTAIWNLTEPPEDWDALAASVVHEMFHAFQSETWNFPWASEIDALLRYRYSAEHLSALWEEARLTEKILRDGETFHYPMLLRLRAWRQEKFPYEYNYQAGIEQTEGTANDVENLALGQLSEEKGKRAWEKALQVISEPRNYLPIRILCYLTGATFLACILRCSDTDVTTFTEELFASAVLSGVSPTETPPTVRKDLADLIERYTEESRAVIRAALEKNDVLFRGKAKINGVNIWDARCDGRYITSNYFVSFREGEETRNLHGDFVIEMDEEKNIVAVYRQ